MTIIIGNAIKIAIERYNNNLYQIEGVLNEIGITSKDKNGNCKTIFMVLSEISDVFNKLNNEIREIEKCVTTYREIMNLSICMNDDFTIKAKQMIQSNSIIMNYVSIGLVGNRSKNELICLLLELHKL